MARPRNLYPKGNLTQEQYELRQMCMDDLRGFVGLVAPQRMLGHCHHDMLAFLMQDVSHELVLWPRGHQKSTLIAYWAAWYIINNPDTTILYASATASLAEAQLTFIKNILGSEIVVKYWPELLNVDEGRRTMWRSDAVCVDHWKRVEEGVRDPTIKAVGMGANIVGFHADVVLLDDIVVRDNAETKTERDKVKTWYSLLTSVLNPGGMIKAVGTRYHPEDLYEDLITMEEEIYNDDGDVVDHVAVYKYSQKVVEVDGQFLWPRQRRTDGRYYGFDQRELSRIKAQYLDKAQYFAQYYNDPSDPLNKRIDQFQYYERDRLARQDGKWKVGSCPLNVYAAIDFAATATQRSDYTAIVVIGIDTEHNIYILDIARFKTDKISEMADRLVKLYDQWQWIRLRAEATAAQNLVVEQLKEYNRDRGIFYSVEKTKPVTEKQIRIMTNLEPRYAAGKIFHYRGGHCQVLEDELTATRPAHDDISDAFASAIEIAHPPNIARSKKVVNLSYHPQFGGIS